MTDEEFSRIYHFLKSRYGVNMTHKRDIVTSRLDHYVKNAGYPSYTAYMDALEGDRSGTLEKDLVNLLTTNHTYFMRESEHFDFLRREVLPWLYKKEAEEEELTIWCGACSTGEEAYALAMILLDFFDGEQVRWDTRVYATDISTDALEQAVEGCYTREQVSKLPKSWRQRFFRPSMDGEHYSVSEGLQKEVVFHKFNLMDPFPFICRVYIIFLRNVMIYFDPPTRQRIMQKVYDSLEPGGYLFIGMSETVDISRIPFEMVQPSIFRKPLTNP